jgi:hypothetical protein
MIVAIGIDSPFSEFMHVTAIPSLAPSDGEKVRVRGNFDRILTARPTEEEAARMSGA